MDGDRRKELETLCRQAESFGVDEMHAMFQRFGLKSRLAMTGPSRSPSTSCSTTIGPEGTSVGFLRPETAQGIFINFERLRDLLGSFPLLPPRSAKPTATRSPARRAASRVLPGRDRAFREPQEQASRQIRPGG